MPQVLNSQVSFGDSQSQCKYEYTYKEYDAHEKHWSIFEQTFYSKNVARFTAVHSAVTACSWIHIACPE